MGDRRRRLSDRTQTLFLLDLIWPEAKDSVLNCNGGSQNVEQVVKVSDLGSQS